MWEILTHFHELKSLLFSWFVRNALFQSGWNWFGILIVVVFDYVRLSSSMFDCWTARLPNVRLRSIGKMFLRFRFSSITEPNRTQSSDWVRLPNVRLATPGQWNVRWLLPASNYCLATVLLSELCSTIWLPRARHKSWKWRGATEHFTEGSEKRFCRLSFEF